MLDASRAPPRRTYALVTGDFVKTGGMDAANLALGLHLAGSGHPTHLISYRADPALVGLPNVQFHRVPKPANAYTLAAPLLGGAGLFWGSRVALAGGTVIANGGGCAFPGVNWVHYLHAAYAGTVQGGPMQRLTSFGRRSLALITERAALWSARAVIANSERTRRDVIGYLGVPPERVHTVYYGTDPRAFRPATPAERSAAREGLGWNDDRPRVGFIGALGDARKGFDVVYDAWRTLVSRSSWDADLIVIGHGRDLPRWRARARADGLGTRMTFLGFRVDVPVLMAAMDALIAPTRYEAYGLGVHEALCCALPALVSADAGVAERYPAALRPLLIEDAGSAAEVSRRLDHWRETRRLLLNDLDDLSRTLRARTWEHMATDIVAIAEATT